MSGKEHHSLEWSKNSGWEGNWELLMGNGSVFVQKAGYSS